MDLNAIAEVALPTQRQALPAWRDGDAFLAGGTWLFSTPQPGVRRLIDLAALDWPPLTIAPHGLSIAATCTIATLDAASLPADWHAAPLIGQCCRALLGSFKVWNMATVGGNVCMALPAGPMTALGVALDGVGVIWTQDGSERTLPVAELVTGPQQTALRPGEVLRSIEIPAAALRRRTGFRRISLNPVGRTGTLVIGTRAADGAFALTITGGVPRPVQLRWPAPPAPESVPAAIEAAVPAWYDDVHGDPAWRRAMTLDFAAALRDELA